MDTPPALVEGLQVKPQPPETPILHITEGVLQAQKEWLGLLKGITKRQRHALTILLRNPIDNALTLMKCLLKNRQLLRERERANPLRGIVHPIREVVEVVLRVEARDLQLLAAAVADNPPI